MKHYKNISEVWSDLDAGLTVNWSHSGYKIYVSDAVPGDEYQLNHFTYRNGKVLSIRYIETYWGSLMHEIELKSLYCEEN